MPKFDLEVCNSTVWSGRTSIIINPAPNLLHLTHSPNEKQDVATWNQRRRGALYTFAWNSSGYITSPNTPDRLFAWQATKHGSLLDLLIQAWFTSSNNKLAYT